MTYRVFCFLFVSSTLLAPASRGNELSFSRDILPLLSENCFFCHGPDEENRAADLRLDEKAAALAVIDKDDPEQSELLRRILSDDPDEQMPPPDSNRNLTAKQKELIAQWLQQGAGWGKHWSFEKLTRPSVPEAAFAEIPVHNPIDAFVQAKLHEKGLTPSAAAPRHTLLRRVSLDLTGLPPTPEAVRTFVADNSDDAYEEAVDRLLDSPAYGERMAWDWLDAARYADSNGYQGDRERTMWPWRDWVVDAFNQNMPFDQFTLQQLAGDLLPNATFEQKLATGFCRNHMINGEGGRIPEENRVDYVMDMSETMGTVWLGLTLNCCRCHDHKYDPLTQENYYQFFAFFNQTPVTGGGGDPQTKPVIAAPTAEQQRRLDTAAHRLAQLETEIQNLAASLRSDQKIWEQQQLASRNSESWQTLLPLTVAAQKMTATIQEDASVFLSGENAANDTYTVRCDIPLQSLASIRLEALRHPSMTQGRLARSNSGNFVLTDVRFTIVEGDRKTPLEIAAAEATVEQSSSLTIQKAFDNDRRSGWAVLKNGVIDRDHAAVFRLSQPINVSADAELEVVLAHDSIHEFHNIGMFRLQASSAADAPLDGPGDELFVALNVDARQRSGTQKKLIRDAFLSTHSGYQKLTKERSQLGKQQNDIQKAAPKVMVMEDRPEWRTTYVLNRGLYNDVTDREVTAQTPESLPGLNLDAERANRLDLARWLISDDQPLTARVTVNRIWQQFFGIGLVKTIEDFGVQAEYPEHKDLLDWLAADFRDNGWNVKRLVKQILMSHTYRQSSVVRTVDRNGELLSLAEVDPENRLLARAPRYRLPSWMLRDQALAAAGLLNREIGGPPVNTYQPGGVWEEATFGKKKYSQDSGDKLYRRSLYIFWRRIIAPTMFFDNASRQTCTVKALRTNTPLHALLTYNETAYVESARHLAERLLTDSQLVDDEQRLNEAFYAVVSRPPSADETEILLSGLRRSFEEYRAAPEAAQALLNVGESKPDDSLDPTTHAAWTSACLALLNLDETLNRE